MRGITVAIWGNPGSGKTTLCAALASRLTASFGNVLLVGTDKYCPAYTQWYPEVLAENEKEEPPLRSLGNILSVPELTVDHFRQYTYLPKANDCIGLMGYLPNQGAEYSEDGDQATAYRFLELAREYAEVTVVDCSSQVSDELAAVVIRECDIMGNLSHKNLPLSLFLEFDDMGFPAWGGSSSEMVNTNQIISALGLGIVRFEDIIPDEEIEEEKGDKYYEYRTDTDVITSVVISAGSEINPDNGPAKVTFNIQGKK